MRLGVDAAALGGGRELAGGSVGVGSIGMVVTGAWRIAGPAGVWWASSETLLLLLGKLVWQRPWCLGDHERLINN